MERIDMAILVVGAVVLSAAVGGAAVYGGTSDLVDFTVTWDTHTADLTPGESVVAGSGGEETFTFDVSQHNLTTATFTVTVEVPTTHLGGDTVQVAVASPNGSEWSGTGDISTNGNRVVIEVPAELGGIPDAERAQGTSVADATARLDQAYGTDRGVGEWTVTVTVDHGGVSGVASDHSVTVEGELEYFEGHLEVPGDLQGV